MPSPIPFWTPRSTGGRSVTGACLDRAVSSTAARRSHPASARAVPRIRRCSMPTSTGTTRGGFRAGNGAVERNGWDGSLDAFYRLDRNNDGRLSRAEMGVAVSGSSFATMDTNNDGRITLGEWPYSHRTFDQQDANGDGVISPQEFNINALPAR